MHAYAAVAIYSIALDHDRFPRRSKSGAKRLLSISLFFRDNPGLAKYHSLENLKLLSIRRFLTGLCYSDGRPRLRQASITAAFWQTINHLNSFIVESTGFILTESTRMTILPAV